MSNSVSWVESDVAVSDFLTDEMRREVCREDGSLHRLYQALAPWPSAILPVHKFYQAILHAPDCPLDLHSCRVCGHLCGDPEQSAPMRAPTMVRISVPPPRPGIEAEQVFWRRWSVDESGR